MKVRFSVMMAVREIRLMNISRPSRYCCRKFFTFVVGFIGLLLLVGFMFIIQVLGG